MAPVLQRTLSIGVALLLGCLLAEGILRLAGWALVESTQRGVRPASALGPDGRTVLCAGDSNTFGIWVDPSESYPGHLERLLDERASGGPHRVVNVGVPGRNSIQLLKTLPADLEAFTPDLLLVLVGFNDRWTWTPEEEGADSPPWYEHLRWTRLIRIVAERSRPRESDDPEDDAPGPRDRLGRFLDRGTVDYGAPVEQDAASRQHAGNLERVVELARERDVPLVLLTYAAGWSAYGNANDVTRDVAERLGVPLIDLRTWFETGAAGREEELFFHDNHPREPGYEVMARLVLNDLIERDLFDAPPVEDVGSALVSRPAPPRLRPFVSPEQEPFLVASEGHVGRPVHFFLARQGPGPRATWNGVELDLADDELFRLTAADPRMTATVRQNGEAAVSVAHLLRILGGAPIESGETVEAIAVSRGPGGPVATAPMEFLVP